jgi:hypothetical protein
MKNCEQGGKKIEKFKGACSSISDFRENVFILHFNRNQKLSGSLEEFCWSPRQKFDKVFNLMFDLKKHLAIRKKENGKNI